MIDKDRIVPFVQLGDYIDTILNGDDKEFFLAIQNQNNWFTEESVRFSLQGIRKFLEQKTLEKWTANYTFSKDSNKRIGVIMASNIPLVGFHDLLSVLISGHSIMAKPGSQDSLLMNLVINKLIEIDPSFKERIKIVERLNEADAFIGTGSDNSARYFKYYFDKKPHIIRKNRTSVAVLSGNESKEDVLNLGKDISRFLLGSKRRCAIEGVSIGSPGCETSDSFPCLNLWIPFRVSGRNSSLRWSAWRAVSMSGTCCSTCPSAGSTDVSAPQSRQQNSEKSRR